MSNRPQPDRPQCDRCAAILLCARHRRAVLPTCCSVVSVRGGHAVSCSLALAAVCVRPAAAGQAQSDTNSQTADSATVTYKKVFKLFPVHPGSPRGEQCSSSMRALQSLGTYRSGALDARRRPRARAQQGPSHTACKKWPYGTSSTVPVQLYHSSKKSRTRSILANLMACPRRGRAATRETLATNEQLPRANT